MTSLLLIAALSANLAQSETQVEIFAGQGTLVKGGSLKKSAKRSIEAAARGLAPDAQATVIVCMDPALTTSSTAARVLGQQVADIVRRVAPSLDLYNVARNVDAEVCPAGIMLEIKEAAAKERLPEVVVVFAKGSVEAELEIGRVIPIYTGSVIPERSTVVTGKDGRAQVRLPSGTLVLLRESTGVMLQELSRSKDKKKKISLRMVAGRLWAKVSGLFGKGTFEVDSQNATASVRGTSFQVGVGREGDQPATKVGVQTGAVNMGNDSRKVDIPAGFGAKAVGDVVSDPIPLPPPPQDLRPIAGTFVNKVVATWTPEPRAVRYRVELAKDVQFLQVIFSVELAGRGVELQAPPGEYYWRVVAIDSDDFESPPSQLFRIAFKAQAE